MMQPSQPQGTNKLGGGEGPRGVIGGSISAATLTEQCYGYQIAAGTELLNGPVTAASG